MRVSVGMITFLQTHALARDLGVLKLNVSVPFNHIDNQGRNRSALLQEIIASHNFREPVLMISFILLKNADILLVKQ
jgi:hypothetical protein